MYSHQVHDHFKCPRNVGVVFEPDASVVFTNQGCGDVLKLTLKVADNRIEQIRFQAQGCVSVIVCASALTEMATGRTVRDARLLQASQISSALGKLTPGTAHGSHLAIKALTAALDQVQQGKAVHSWSQRQ